MRDLFAEIENIYLMQLYQHIYVYKTMIKKVQPEKNDESNSNSNIFMILHLTFDMFCYFL